MSRLDYGNATLVGIPANLSRHLQSVLNAAARSIAGLRRSDHITNTLASFHWLRVSERIQFKLATLIYRSLRGLAPQYLVDDLRCVTDIPGRRRLRSASSFQLEIPRTRLVTVGDRTFSAAGRGCGTVCRATSLSVRLSLLFVENSNISFLVYLSLDIDCFCFSHVDLEVFT